MVTISYRKRFQGKSIKRYKTMLKYRKWSKLLTCSETLLHIPNSFLFSAKFAWRNPKQCIILVFGQQSFLNISWVIMYTTILLINRRNLGGFYKTIIYSSVFHSTYIQNYLFRRSLKTRHMYIYFVQINGWKKQIFDV